VRIASYSRAAVGLALTGALLFSRTARAEVTLIEKDGWTFAADGRVNVFLSTGFGDGFPQAAPAPIDPASGLPTRPEYDIVGATAGWTGWKAQTQEDTERKYFAMRNRSGFMGSVLGFSLKREVVPGTTAKGYIGLWTDVEATTRDKLGTLSTDVSQGFVSFDGYWGGLLLGRDLGLFGRMSTEIDFNYGHNYGLGLPCMDLGGNPGCGHVGTGVMGAGFGAGIVYTTPSLSGLTLKAGLYDPVRLLGAWYRAPILRPEGQLAFETKIGTKGMFKVGVEGLYQPLSNVSADGERLIETSVWGVAGGARLELGPVRFGAAAFQGRGLGFYTALQNDPAVFELAQEEDNLRTFTGLYGQGALVFGPLQFSLGAGTAMSNQLPIDVTNPLLSNAKSQTGISAGVFYSISDSVVLGLDYFRFMVRWYGARNSHYTDPADTATLVIDEGVIEPERQDMNFVNAGLTYHW
jgi:Gram-negative porin